MRRQTLQPTEESILLLPMFPGPQLNAAQIRLPPMSATLILSPTPPAAYPIKPLPIRGGRFVPFFKIKHGART